jgi:paraquat-inducible protein B
MLIQQAMINEIRQGITMLQQQDNAIIKEASNIFQGMHKQIHDSMKINTENATTLLNHRRSIMKLQEDVRIISISNISLASKVEAIEKFVKTLPTKEDLSTHARAMDKALAKIQEVSTGLTVHMEEYKMSGSTTHAPRSEQAGPIYRHSDSHPQVEEYYEYESSLSTQGDARQYYGLRGGTGSEEE